MFFETYATSSSSKDVSFDQSNKWTGETGKNFVEGELDVSYIAAMAPGVKTLVANTNISESLEAKDCTNANANANANDSPINLIDK